MDRCLSCNAVDEEIIEDKTELRKYPIMLKVLDPLLAWDMYRGSSKIVTLMAVKNMYKQEPEIKLYCWIKNNSGIWTNTNSGIKLQVKYKEKLNKLACMYERFEEKLKNMKDGESSDVVKGY
jgi:hypothetical protein